MRSFLAISLAVMAGCGDNVADPSDDLLDDVSGFDDIGDQMSEGTPGKLLPRLCAAHTWDAMAIPDKDLILRATRTNLGTSIMVVPTKGGHLDGFVSDARGQVIGDGSLQRILDGNFTGLSTTYADGRLVTALVDGSKSHVYLVKNDMNATYFLETIADSTAISDSAIVHTRGQRLIATGGRSGILTERFDRDWLAMGANVLDSTVPNALSSAAYGGDAVIAWSTGGTCSMGRISTGEVSTRDFACNNPRIATDYANRTGFMTYERNGNVYLAELMIDDRGAIADGRLLAQDSKSPRIAFDGKRFWVSFINKHDNVSIGYLDEKGKLIAMGLFNIIPETNAFDMLVANGETWVYAADGVNGYTASRVCLEPEAR